MIVMAFLGSFANMLGNGVFNACMMLALPEANRGGILGLFQSACTGGCALSAVLYGLLCDIFPISYVFAVGAVLSIIPMVYMCLHRDAKEFILTH